MLVADHHSQIQPVVIRRSIPNSTTQKVIDILLRNLMLLFLQTINAHCKYHLTY